MSHFDTQPACVDVVNKKFDNKNSLMRKRRFGAGLSKRRKAANREDARYVRQEKLIRRGLDSILERRSIGVKTVDFCELAGISSAVFYAHYASCDEALTWYELELEEEFVRSLPQNAGRDLGFTLLLSFVLRHRQYFASNFKNRNMYLLARLVRYVCVPAEGLNQKAHVLYVCSVEAMIWCWGECDKFSTRKMEKYQQKIMLLRVMDYGL